MTHDPKTEAWTLFADSQQLTDAEQLALSDAFEDLAAGYELAADQRLHRMLSGMKHVDETRENFISQVERACQESQGAQTQSTPAQPPRQLELTTEPTVRQVSSRKQQRAVWMHPLVLVLSGTTIAASIILMMAVGKLSTLSDQVAGLQNDLRDQKADFEDQLDNLKHPPIDPLKITDLLQPRQRPADRGNPGAQAGAPIPVAILMGGDNAQWERAPDGKELPAGPLNLTGGAAELLMADGTQLDLRAPAQVELLNPGHVALNHGNIQAIVPDEDRGFRVSTPTAQIVDLGRQFRVVVDEVGDTNVEAQDGELIVIPTANDPGVRRWHLIPEKFARALISKPDQGDGKLLSSKVTGPAGFQGQLQLGGNGIVLNDAAEFQQLQNGILQRFQEAPQQTVEEWLQLAESFNSLRATMNGQDILMDFFGPRGGMPQIPALNNNQVNMFVGRVVINGEQRTFHSPEEFDAFRRQMMQPFRNQAQGNNVNSQFDEDLKTDPFLPQD